MHWIEGAETGAGFGVREFEDTLCWITAFSMALRLVAFEPVVD